MLVSENASGRGWVGWVVQNKIAAGGIVASLVLVTSGLVLVAARSGDDKKGGASNRVAAGATTTSSENATAAGETSTTGSALPGVTTAKGKVAGKGTGAGGSTIVTLPRPIPPAPPCTPKPGYTQHGLTDTTVEIAQLVSNVPQLPAQLEPNHEGLIAAVSLINDTGRVCGRKLHINYQNDQVVLEDRYYQDMMSSNFAFVANSSLQDGASYEDGTTGTFNPRYKDGNEYVPDIGGLAYSYGRNQSQWFAGVLGSLSPSLAGGLGFNRILAEAKNPPAGYPGHGACRELGLVVLSEPTGASADQGDLGKAALENNDWGGHMAGHVHIYSQQLAAQRPQWQQTVQAMEADHVTCAFTYADLGSNITLAQAMQDEGVWPPDQCDDSKPANHPRGACFSVYYMPFSGYDPSYISQAGDAAKFTSTFVPHPPLNETSNPALKGYTDALKKYQPGKSTSTFGLIGYASGLMFAEALQTCGAAPTRACVMDAARKMQNYTATGLIGGTTPFKSTRVNCATGCGNFPGKLTYDFKWIFTCTVAVRVLDRGGKRDFYRTVPASGYDCDTLHVARGQPA